jgi:hypothetical protein
MFKFIGLLLSVSYRNQISLAQSDPIHQGLLYLVCNGITATPTYLMSSHIMLSVRYRESHGLVVRDEDSQLSGCGFESRRRILDGVSKASYFITLEKKK